tara:strand:- start:2239 stop:2646 length:408 start_codon:yes stop_codon:yes gene_type:complete
MVCASAGKKPTADLTHHFTTMISKQILAASSIALIGTASTLAMAAPAHALDGCGPRGRFSHSQQRCIRRSDVFRNPQKQWAADQSCGYRYRYSARQDRCVFRRTVRVRPVVRRRLVAPVHLIRQHQPALRLNFSF